MRIFKLLCFVISLAIIMDFIPIKLAKKVDKIKYNNETYVCKYVTATEGNWLAEMEYNPQIEAALYLNIMNKSTFDSLKEISNLSLGDQVWNMYVFTGTVEKRIIDENNSFDYIKLQEWDIVYPIKRQSIRDKYVPKTYLTIYDYDWWKIMQ